MSTNSSPRPLSTKTLRLIRDFVRDEGGGAPASPAPGRAVRLLTAGLLIVVIGAGLVSIAA